MKIALTKRFLAAAGKLSDAERAATDAALSVLLATYGRPHAHTGASVRPLKPPVYEMRISLDLRVVFVRVADTLKVDFVGNHDAVRAYLKNMR